jgi:hypothetical protein
MGTYGKDLDDAPGVIKYRLDDVAGDGACLFRAILLSYYGGGNYKDDAQNYRDLYSDEQTARALELREECIQWNITNWYKTSASCIGTHGPLIDEKFGYLYEGSIDKMPVENAKKFYRLFMENKNEWADMPEITAAAEVLNIKIIVYPKYPPLPYQTYDGVISVIGAYMGNDDRNAARPNTQRRCRIFHQDDHYQAFVPNTDSAHRYHGDRGHH